ncbi:osteoclast-associated immunoglobulin-like receptor isoform X2 [Pogona vitticeps]
MCLGRVEDCTLLSHHHLHGSTNEILSFSGWWLTGLFGLSGGQFHMKPSISVSPSVVVPVGENATIRCKSEGRYLPVAFILFKEESGSWQSVSTKEIEEGEAVFHIIHAKPSDAGTYWCSFGSEYFPWHRRYSSDKVHIKTKEVVYSKPFISLNPMGLVPLGAVVTVQCKNTEHRLAKYYLLKEGSPEPTQVKRSDGKEVVFSIANVTLSDGGIYWCEYRDSSSLSDRYSQASDRLYLNVTDPSLARPFIQMEPKGPHVLGANVTIHCQGPEKGLTFFLYRSMDLVASQIAKSDSNMTTFSILTVRAEDAGNYTCQYHGKGNPFVWSKPTVPMKLVVKDDSQVNHASLYFASLEIWIRLGVGIVVLLALMLILAEAIYSWRTEQHFKKTVFTESPRPRNGSL